jgi:LPS O-antigen subunit length determinant protein (WzzB/FepE family)
MMAETRGKNDSVKDQPMDKSQLANELNELVKQFGGAADPTYNRLVVLAKQAEDSQKQIQQNVDYLSESLDYLRVCIKYLLLDIEATRRENDYLRKLLNDPGREE